MTSCKFTANMHVAFRAYLRVIGLTRTYVYGSHVPWRASRMRWNPTHTRVARVNDSRFIRARRRNISSPYEGYYVITLRRRVPIFHFEDSVIVIIRVCISPRGFSFFFSFFRALVAHRAQRPAPTSRRALDSASNDDDGIGVVAFDDDRPVSR